MRRHDLKKVVPYWLVVAALAANWAFDLLNIHIHLS